MTWLNLKVFLRVLLRIVGMQCADEWRTNVNITFHGNCPPRVTFFFHDDTEKFYLFVDDLEILWNGGNILATQKYILSLLLESLCGCCLLNITSSPKLITLGVVTYRFGSHWKGVAAPKQLTIHIHIQ